MIIEPGFWTSLGKIRGLCQSEIQQIEARSCFWCLSLVPFWFWPLHTGLSFVLSVQNVSCWWWKPCISGYVICSAYLRCFKRKTMCKGVSTQNIVPVVYQNRGRGEGKAMYLGWICLVLRWSETSDAFRWIKPWKSYLKHRKEAIWRLHWELCKMPHMNRPAQEEKPWWALGVGICLKW